MNSLQGKYRQLQTVFVVLAVLIAIQMLLLYGLHIQNKGKLTRANQQVKVFLELVKSQNSVFINLSEAAENKSKQILPSLSEEINVIREKVADWGRESVETGFLTEALVQEELRRLNSFQKAIVKVRSDKYAEADAILQVEKNVFFSRPLVVSSIMSSVINENESAEFFIQSCFLLSLLLNIPVFTILLMFSKQLFHDVRNDMNTLESVTTSISQGNDQAWDNSNCLLEESNKLFEAFSAMEVAIRNRRMLSKDEVQRAKKSTKVLEVAVEKSSQEVEHANEQLSRKNEELEQILYAASHDLRTPLIGVQGFSQELQYLAEILQEELGKSGLDIESNERLKDILKQDIPNSVNFILKGSNKMDTMIQGLLRISRMGLESFKFSKVDMDDLLKQIVDGLSFQAQSSNSMIVVEDLDSCDADIEKIEQVFTNLIVNAIKYRREGIPCEINISSQKVGEFIHYLLKDNGQGISEENLKNIHKTFFRVDGEEGNGEGLGLTIANRIIERHGGTLEVTSKLDEGSCFTVILPMKQDLLSKGDDNE